MPVYQFRVHLLEMRRIAGVPSIGDACHDTPKDHIGYKPEYHRDDHSFDRIEALEYDELIDPIHDESKGDYPCGRIQSLAQPRYPVLAIADDGPEIWRAACSRVSSAIENCSDCRHQRL